MLDITYEYGYSGEIIVLVNGRRYCTVDNWQEYREAREHILTRHLIELELEMDLLEI